VQISSQTREQIAEYGTAIVSAFRAPLQVDGRELLITVSAGFSTYPQDGTSAEPLENASENSIRPRVYDAHWNATSSSSYSNRK
jgi:GGDEF domain-containing protein